jgi:hypothetical protein
MKTIYNRPDDWVCVSPKMKRSFMKRQFLLLLCVGVFLTGSLVAVFPGRGQVTTPPRYTRSEIDFRHFPVVDLAASLPSDESAKAIRARKSKKYNNKSLSQTSEVSNATFVVNEVLRDLPALPVAKVPLF